MSDDDHTPLFAHLATDADHVPAVQPTRCCVDCGVVKPLRDFPVIKRNRDGRSGTCKPCYRARRPKVSSPPPHYVPPESRACTRCKVVKSLSDYSSNRRNWDGKQSICRGCDLARQKAFRKDPEGRIRVAEWGRRSAIKSRYGLTEDEFNRRVADQGGVCAICGKPPTGGVRSRHLVVDHCHVTGRTRDLLCSKCNTALGQFGDSVAGLMKAVAYLQRHETETGANPDAR
jgi:hypothetical protein